MMECPTCFQRIIVPQAPAGDDVELIITGSKAHKRMVSTPEPHLGTPPIPTPPVKDFPVAVIAIIALLCAVIVAVFVFHGRIFQSTNVSSTAPGQINPVPPQNIIPAQPVNPVPPQNTTPAQPVIVAPPAYATNWTLTPGELVIPNTIAVGRIHGRSFFCQRVYLEAGTLTMRTANKGLPNLGLSVYLRANRSQDLAGRTVNVSSDSTNAPNIRLRWKDDQQQPMTMDFNKGYALRIEFGQLEAGTGLQGKFYLAVPDETKSYVAGTFNAQIRMPKPPR